MLTQNVKLKINLDLHIENGSTVEKKNTCQPFHSAKNCSPSRNFADKYNKNESTLRRTCKELMGVWVGLKVCVCVYVHICVLSECRVCAYG